MLQNEKSRMKLSKDKNIYSDSSYINIFSFHVLSLIFSVKQLQLSLTAYNIVLPFSSVNLGVNTNLLYHYNN